MIFRENKKLNLELESASSEITTLRSVHDDTSAKPYNNCKMIMVNYADLWLMHSHVASLLDGARVELRELKTRSTLLGACTTSHLLRSDLKAAAIKIKDLKHKLDQSSRYTVLSAPCEACVSLKGKLLHTTKENTELQQKVAYLIVCLEKIVLSEKMIKEHLSRIEESATNSKYRLGVGFERCEDKGEKSAPKFIPSYTYHKEEEIIKPIKAHYPSNSKSSFNPKREARKKKPPGREMKHLFACFVTVLVTSMSFTSGVRELRGDVLSMLETHIMMSSLISHLVLILMFRLTFTLILRLALLHVLFLSSLMDLTIAHMVLAHKRTALNLDALITAHVLVMVIISHVCLIFLLKGFTSTLS
jgi:cation transport ATPase